MKYRTMNRKEFASELGISTTTLYRRMKKLNPKFQELIKNRALLYDEQIKYIHENIVCKAPCDRGLDEQTRKTLFKSESPSK